MKSLMKNKCMLILTAIFLTAVCVYAYPPDNAAVLYYKAAAIYDADHDMTDMLRSFRKGEIELNDKIRQHVAKNYLVINTVLDASEVQNCDWGMNYSEGMQMQVPHISDMRRLAFLVIADTKILAEEGNYKAALNRCMSLYKMARHTNDGLLISSLVGMSINRITNDSVMEIMADMPQDIESLTQLKNRLVEIEAIPFSLKPAILAERDSMLSFMTLENMPELASVCGENKAFKEKILSLDEAAIERNKKYFKNYYAVVIAAFDMPYVKGYTALVELWEKEEKDVESNPDAILTRVLAPATQKILSHKTKFETYNNAVSTAVELYLIKAKTGKLPNIIPAGLPGDLFSGRSFAYKKTAKGFILRCRGEDLSQKETYEYEFKVKK